MRFLEGELKTAAKALVFYIPFSHLFLNFLKIIQKGSVCSFLATPSSDWGPSYGGMRGPGGSEGDRAERGQPSRRGNHKPPRRTQAPSCRESAAPRAQQFPSMFPHPLVSFSPHIHPPHSHLCLAKPTSLLIEEGNLFGWGVGSGPHCVLNRGFHFYL